MSSDTKIGIALALVTVVLAVIGLWVGFFSITPAVGLAVVGIVIGTGVARGAFSNAPGATRKD